MMKKLLSNTTFVAVFLFVLSLSIYTIATNSYKPFYSYHHNLYVAKGLLQGRFDVSNIPDYYHDVTVKDGRTYVPFGPTPALALLPFVALFGVKENLPQLVGAFLGAINVVLVYLLLNKLRTINYELSTAKKTAIAVFFAFGTVHFYTVFIGSTWYFSHIVAVFFLLLAMNLIFTPLHTKYYIRYTAFAGLFLGLAILARAPILLSLPFFIHILKKHKTIQPYNHIAIFLISMAIPLFFQLLYNAVRFDSIFQDGHALVYNNYKNFPIPQTIFRVWWSDFPLFNFLDIRNIPIHFITAYLLPPKIISTFPFLEFSPYGTSILITSPLWLLVLRANWKHWINRASAIIGLGVMLVVFLHFMQGWVQFSYRYSLDFAPLFLIPLASGIQRTNKYTVYILLAISIIMNTLGILYGAR